MANTRDTSELALFGGTPVVTEKTPPWPYFSDAEIEEVRQLMLRSREDFKEACSALGGGTAEEFENRFAASVGRSFAVATCGCGPALHIACMAAGVELGDEVITTPYSWGQTCAAVLQAGAVPIFADIDPESLTLDPASIEARITDRTKAIVLCHIFGVPAEMDKIIEVARRHNLPVIEDCAQAHGSKYDGKPIGSHGDISCFSIGSGKNLAAGDGGVLVTDDRRLYEKSLLAGMHPGRANKQIQDPELKSQVGSLIYTYRISTFTAAVALRQMERLDALNGWRRENGKKLQESIKNMPGIRPCRLSAKADPAWHMIPWTFVPEEVPGISRQQYIQALKAEGVPIKGSYVGTPIHLRQTFRNKTWWLGKGYPWQANPRGDEIVYREGDCPVAEKRCSELDLIVGGGSWYQDCSRLIAQITEAFQKVTGQLDQVARQG